MHNFDSLKNMWQQTPAANQVSIPATLSSKAVSARLRLQRQHTGGAVMLVITALLITGMAVFGNFNFQHTYTYGAMYLVSLICLLQSGLFMYTNNKLKSIDETATPALHLQQWEAYYAFRKRQVRWNMPLYFTTLNLAMGLYLLEVLNGRPVVYVIIFLVLYGGWMVYAIFFLGKKNLQKEKQRLQLIIDELKDIEQQIEDAG